MFFRRHNGYAFGSSGGFWSLDIPLSNTLFPRGYHSDEISLSWLTGLSFVCHGIQGNGQVLENFTPALLLLMVM